MHFSCAKLQVCEWMQTLQHVSQTCYKPIQSTILTSTPLLSLHKGKTTLCVAELSNMDVISWDNGLIIHTFQLDLPEQRADALLKAFLDAYC